MAAAPTSTSLKDMTGQWTVHKGHSDDFNAVLALQGVPWWKRQAAGIITVTENVTHTRDENKAHRIVIVQQLTAGFKGGTQTIVPDGSAQASQHDILGAVTERATWSDLSNINDEWLKEGWITAEDENSGPNGERHIQVIAINEQLGWELTVVWGFVLIEGERFHCRRVVCRKGDQTERTRSVYGWVGASEK